MAMGMAVGSFYAEKVCLISDDCRVVMCSASVVADNMQMYRQGSVDYLTVE